MCRKLIFLACFVFVLGLFLTSAAQAELVGWWRLDEGSGTTAADSSVGGNDGTFVGSPQWVAGKVNGALEFDGGDSVSVAGAANINPESLTLMTWVNFNVVSNTSVRQDYLSRGDDYGFSLHEDNADQRIHGVVTSAGAWSVVDGQTVVEADIWYHTALTYDAGTDMLTLYLDGEVDGELSLPAGLEHRLGGPLTLGTYSGRDLLGKLDEVKIFDVALSQDEIKAEMKGAGFPYASRPNPEEKAMTTGTYATMSWQAGDFAVSHDVYMGDNFDDVNDGTGDTFRVNQKGTFYVAGFTGYAYPDGLVPGTTYYWRIDEVNDANAASPWKGKVWSFWVQPKTAYAPVPGDGSKFIDSENLKLNWSAGFSAIVHTVYFSDNFDDVNNGVNGSQAGVTSYTPGPLEIEKTYYWRVDEFGTLGTYTGDVWSFTTAKIGGGIRGDYYRGMNFENFVLTRTDPEINFNWGDPGGPDATVGDDTFSCRWTGEVEAAFTETYTFYAAADDGVRLWVDGVQLVNAWRDQGTTEYNGTIDLVAGNSYSVIMEQYENGGGATAYLRWSSKSTPKQIIPQAALAPPVKASSPSPSNRATGTKMTPILRWGAGESAVSHELYFGTDADAVRNATKSSPEYKGVKALGDEIYDPGKLAWFTEYFWRVDEVNNLNPDSPWVGNLWSFTTGDFLVIDDFEAYNAGDNQIWYSWIDGLGFGAQGTGLYSPGNGTGAAVGDETTASFTEESIRHGGSKSMPLYYDNNKQGYSKYSETELTLIAPRDWTQEGVANLSLWFRGYPASTGSFVEGPVGTFTMTGAGADIWFQSDEFHYAYKTLSGQGSIVARVGSLTDTNASAKAAVMIRETLAPDSKYWMAAVRPGSNGTIAEYRAETGENALQSGSETAITAPYWVKIDRDLAGNFTAYSSANGSTWQMVGVAEPISMGATVYIGLAVTSHDAALTCQAVFSNVTTTGNVSGQWAHQDIGINSNAAEPLYVTVSNATGSPAVVVNDDANAAQIDTWTQWVIPLQAFADQGITLTNVDRIAIGLGTKGNITIPGGSGKLFIDDIRLTRPAPEPEPEPEPQP